MESRNFLTRTLGQTQEENGNSELPLPNRQAIRGELAAKRWWLNLTNKSISKMAHSASGTPERSCNSCLDYVQLQNLWFHEKSCNLLQGEGNFIILHRDMPGKRNYRTFVSKMELRGKSKNN